MHNLFLGDNLLVLKNLVAKKYSAGVQYIDPPYNNAGAFGYASKKINWNAFMAERLRLAHRLMATDGIIFISIDETEQAPLTVLCASVFQDCDFTHFIWQNKHTITNDKRNGLCSQTESILCYSKKGFVARHKPLNPEYIKKTYNHNDSDGRGCYRIVPVYKKKTKPSFTVISPTGKSWTLGWNFTKTKWDSLVADNRIYWGKTGGAQPQKKVYLSTTKGVPHRNLLLGDEVGFTGDGTTDLNKVFGEEMRCDFLYPKPVRLIKYLVHIHPRDNATVLDWFAGTGTTFQAVYELNRDYGTQHRSILITLDESGKDICWRRMSKIARPSEITKKEVSVCQP